MSRLMTWPALSSGYLARTKPAVAETKAVESDVPVARPYNSPLLASGRSELRLCANKTAGSANQRA